MKNIKIITESCRQNKHDVCEELQRDVKLTYKNGQVELFDLVCFCYCHRPPVEAPTEKDRHDQ